MAGPRNPGRIPLILASGAERHLCHLSYRAISGLEPRRSRTPQSAVEDEIHQEPDKSLHEKRRFLSRTGARQRADPAVAETFAFAVRFSPRGNSGRPAFRGQSLQGPFFRRAAGISRVESLYRVVVE